MPRAVEGFQINDLSQYRPAPNLADGDTGSGLEAARFNSVTSAASGVLDFGPSPGTAAKLHAAVRYRNTAGFAWRYSQDGVTWTAVNSSVSAGNTTDAAFPAHACQYSGETCVTTLGGSGITARYWQASVQDSDLRAGSGWQCGGSGFPSSRAGLMEIWAENGSGTRLREWNILPCAKRAVLIDGRGAVSGDAVLETASGESD